MPVLTLWYARLKWYLPLTGCGDSELGLEASHPQSTSYCCKMGAAEPLAQEWLKAGVEHAVSRPAASPLVRGEPH